MGKLQALIRLDVRTLLLFTEAYLMLAAAKLQLYRPFAKVAGTLGYKRQETHKEIPLEHIRTIKHITSAIAIMSRYTPWDSQCLVRAIAGMRMLKRRRIPGTLYLGTAKDDDGNLIAHAWLRSGPLYISGADVMKDFTVVESFASASGE
ncbi:lasso peptide biosynthesis B2 protein [Paenibacillus chungangensis]|uniref:Lasso peptide biosynthesis B2 protein n=1 Tax=Paenibacillus chungangensis TaxID=696535 RepID=A0ABW3HVA2_9BACL